MFDDHLLPSHEVSVPTICIGNLAIGGTGKTPHTEWLVSLLKDRYKIAVLSRGYGRKTHGFHMADERSTALTIGDEPMQIHHKFPDVPVAVCEIRVTGVKQLQRMVPGLQVVILDDAFQHRSIRCGLNILLTTEPNLFIDDHLLPWGTLRDLKRRYLAAHAIIVTKCPETFRPIDKRVIDNRLHLPAFQQLYFSKVVYDTPDLTEYKKPLVLSAIAHPEELLQHIRQTCPKAEAVSFRDHHRFTERDIRYINDISTMYDVVLTTEKDYERLLLTPLPEQLGDKLKVVAIRADLDIDAPRLERQITTYINESLRKTHKP